MRKPPRPQPAAGFTLVEVLVALVIVAVALAAGLRAAQSLTTSAERARSMTLAQWCADNQLTGIRLARQFPPVGRSDFSCEQLGVTLGGQIAVQPTPNPNFRRADVTVLDADGHRLLSISTVIPR
ncbi:type II secretion system minor pseudopilin GspI [Amphibiibacter pelophylacis]|uniref:Type II secretion system minor pseudopilin GspI n=1 Tax=Amphibiibacter pelophylacis TaxID=1799477 RepID=A0ACC6P3U9_9BURK